ncbi:hypothetical protein [Streptococcus intermedius]|uniref:hypothetical protein n=1 Tax=Streptococcus intermedius TaxID=1338 RepID=UPI0002329621|nr:hypothetical protein [Streptococcus intermedius]EHG13378.1 hypothetical protein HMPREF9177_00663 [Streptococcus intermedius F0413]QKH78025.1 hypothetical protein FOC71_05770 [Streptococcus intermedius]
MASDVFYMLNELSNDEEFEQACVAKDYSKIESILVSYKFLEPSLPNRMNGGYMVKVAIAAIVSVVGVVAAVANFVIIMPNSKVSIQNPLLQYILLIINKYSSPDFVLEVAEKFQKIEASHGLNSGLS